MEITAEDISYEEDVLKNPFQLKSWWYYLEYKADAPEQIRYLIYERSLRILPRSYKLWFAYLTERMERCKDLCIRDVAYKKINNCFERCLVHMYKMPRIWSEYLHCLMKQKKITKTRHTFDRALRALPITQHEKWIWPAYIEFANENHVPPETAMRIYRRYLKLEPSEIEDFVRYLKENDRLDQAAVYLAKMVNDDRFVSAHGKTKHELWTDLLTLITKNPEQVKTLNVEQIIRGGIRRFSHEVGRLWTALGDYYIRLGHFEKARDIYEEGINTVATVRDFSVIFDAYASFEESMLAAKMENAAEDSDSDSDSEDEDEQIDIELRLLRLEHLTDRRDLLKSSVILRQNPHNVVEWHNRVKLFKKDPAKVIMTYTDAVTTVDPQKATGKPHTLWVAFAKFYELHGDIENARVIFEKATMVNYKSVNNLASLWCDFAELELRHENYKEARIVMKRATECPRNPTDYWILRKKGINVPVQKLLHKNTRLWAFYADLEENLGTLQSAKAIYEKMLSLKVITPQIILNYANFMEEHKFFEDSFRVYEKGVSIFNYPHVYPIWVAYLKKFIGRYQGTKLERTRDLFEQSVEGIPAKESKKIFLLYAKFEETYGLCRRAMDIYNRACQTASVEDKLDMYLIYIARCAEFFGVTKTRDIYEKAIESLSDRDLKPICLKYADVEKKLGEIDRARAIYTYVSQYCDPRTEPDFWKKWHDFEVHHGNEDTFREMLRLRRSVRAQFSHATLMSSNFVKEKMRVDKNLERQQNTKRQKTDAIETLEAEHEAEHEAEQEIEKERINGKDVPVVKNPEEIDISIDEIGDDDITAKEAKMIKTQPIPTSLLGTLSRKDMDGNKKMTALERFKQKSS